MCGNVHCARNNYGKGKQHAKSEASPFIRNNPLRQTLAFRGDRVGLGPGGIIIVMTACD